MTYALAEIRDLTAPFYDFEGRNSAPDPQFPPPTFIGFHWGHFKKTFQEIALRDRE